MVSLNEMLVPNSAASRVLERKKEVSSSSKKEEERKTPLLESPFLVPRVARYVPTAEEVRAALSYCPLSGKFVWRVSSARAKAGSQAGYYAKGYVCVGLFGMMFRAHRLAWLYMTGEWPSLAIDHINGVRDDNRFANLRLATNQQNAANRPRSANNKSGVKGVYWHLGSRKWVAQINVSGKRIHLGAYESKWAAKAAYWVASVEHFGEFARAK
jgi:hypothetical protein